MTISNNGSVPEVEPEEFQRAEEAPHFAIEETIRHIRDFMRGTVWEETPPKGKIFPSGKLRRNTPPERLRLLYLAREKLAIAGDSIVSVPGYANIQWLLETKLTLAKVERDLPAIDPPGTREFSHWAENISQVGEQVTEFQKNHEATLRDVFEKVSSLWRHVGTTVQPTIDVSATPTGQAGRNHVQAAVVEDGTEGTDNTKWITSTDAAIHLLKGAGDFWTTIGTCKGQITKRANSGELRSNGKRGPDRLIAEDSVDALIRRETEARAIQEDAKERDAQNLGELRKINRR